MSSGYVLIADDSGTIRTQVARALRGAGFEVSTASDGMEAMRHLRREPPLLAVLDVQMPKLDAFRICQNLKQMGEPWNSVPIVFLSASHTHAAEQLGDEWGAYVRKPISTERLLEVVRDCLEKALALSEEANE